MTYKVTALPLSYSPDDCARYSNLVFHSVTPFVLVAGGGLEPPGSYDFGL